MSTTSSTSGIAPKTSSGWLRAECITLGYQSSSYLTDRIPALGVVDLPFLFSDQAKARGAMDGALGQR